MKKVYFNGWILDFKGSTPLHIALMSEALDSIPLLIAFGADLNALTNLNETPVMVGSKFG